MTRMKKYIPLAAILALLLPLLAFIAAPVSRDTLTRRSSLVLLSTEGRVLHVFRSALTGAYGEWVPLEEDDDLIRTVLRAEDRRFYYHPGVDPLAIIRALGSNLAGRRIVSGGSTITQQLARIVWADAMPRYAIPRKLMETLFALRLEYTLSKHEILEAYLNLVPLRGNHSGLFSASLGIFGRKASLLSRREKAALAVFIRRGAMSPDSFQRRFDRLYRSLYPNEPLTPEDANELTRVIFMGNSNSPHPSSGKEASPSTDSYMMSAYGDNQFAGDGVVPHFVNWLTYARPSLKGRVTTTISENLTSRVDRILNGELMAISRYGGTNGAVIVMELPEHSGDPMILRVMAGSRDFSDPEEGEVNGCVAVRSAGSTLKPLLFALAMDLFGLMPYSFIEDREISVSTSVSGESFRPQNYDMKFWGSMTIRDALATSRNIPAVILADRIGIPAFYDFLRRAGFTHLEGGPDHYGAGLALGSGGASLLQLVCAYSALSRDGRTLPFLTGTDGEGRDILIGGGERLFSEQSALLVTHILADREARRKAFGMRNYLDFPFEVAAKSGTSSSYRDAWMVGYTDKYLVGVWVGDFSGKKMQGVSGGWGAGRIFHQVIREVTGTSRPRFSYPPGWKSLAICRVTGKLASPRCESITEPIPPGREPGERCTGHDGFSAGMHAASRAVEGGSGHFILSPSDGEIYLLDPHLPRAIQQVPLEFSLPSSERKKGTFLYSVNSGTKSPVHPGQRGTLNLGKGHHGISLFRNEVLVQTVRFQVK